jgi:cell wall-associated NlpC family hydrolase
MTTRAEIVAIARSLVGTPYAHQGRVAGLSLDCAGVPVFIAKAIGFPVEDFIAYGRLPVPAQMRAKLDEHLDRVPKAGMQIGDVVWIRFESEPQHLGILADYAHGGFSLIHANNGGGKHGVVEHRLDEAWARRIVAVWRYRGVE